MATLPPRSVIKAFGQAKPTKSAYQSPLQSLTSQHQQQQQTAQQHTQQQINQLTNKQQRINSAVVTANNPTKTYLKKAGEMYGNRANALRAKINGRRTG